MEKHSLNLIIKKETDSPLIHKIKLFLPLSAFISLLLFGLIFTVSVIYINSNISQFNLLKKEVERLEKRISDQKTAEGIYTFSLSKLNVLGQILNGSKNFSPLISEIINLPSSEVNITSANADAKDNVAVSLVASSSAAMDRFVTLLLEKEKEKTISQIYAQGITREKKGSYLFTITFKSNSALLQ